MAGRMSTKLEEFFEDRTDGRLRSIVKYEETEYELTYIREDVREQYSEEEVRSAVDESVMNSLSVPIYEDVFSDEHGDLTCFVQCFEKVIEMNFVLADGVGAAVAIDEEAMANTSGLISNAREIVLNERD